MEEASNPFIDANIINWHYEDVKFSKFVIYGFGKNTNGDNCTICIEDYKPEMYIRIRLNSDNNNDKNQFMIDLDSKSNENLKKKLLDSIDYICSKPLKCAKLKEKENKESEESSSSNENDFCCLEHCPQDLLSNPPYPINASKSNIIRSLCKIENKKDLYESFGHNDIVALKIVFKTQMAFNRLKKALKHRIHNFDGSSYKNVFVTINQQPLHNKNYIIDTYKSDLPPLLDFFHNRDIQPCGWISFEKTKCKKSKTNVFVDSNVYYLSFKDINKLDKFEYAPFKIMSWDIEADSSHGDFPLAKKDYKKLGVDIADFYLDYIDKTKNPDKKTLYNIFKYILCVAFNIKNKYTLTNELEQKIKSSINTIYLKTELSNNDEDLLKDKDFIKELMSICDKNKNKSLSSSNTTQLDRLFLNNINEDYEEDDDDKPKTIKKISNRDIIINKIMKLCEEKLPEVQGDRIIQIGCVFHKFGKKENKNYILTLGSCDKFDEETTIYSYGDKKDINSLSIDELDKEESNLIMKFQDIIQEEQPDIILGYNTFGFDNKFLFNRMEELYLQDSFGYFGKMDKKTELKIKMLSSAALGDNILNIMPTIGRTEIDLLKIIQRDHNLDSYSLNNVSEKFIGDKKDDVTPKQIFEYQRANSEKRGIIAKYCVKDCVLLIDLMNKLDILSANIGMANVCSVPLEFIILRGQGIKIQSLVSKECKNENYILRELEKTNSDSSYEGAIVLPPSKGLYLEDPVSVLDYASLYPSSMIASNISHEGIVKTETYDDKNANLDEIEEINLYNMKDGIEFRYVEKYKKKNKDFNEEDFQNEIKSYNKFPLLDSIYLTTLKYRFIRKCKFKLYLSIKFYEKIKNKEEIKLKEFIETCKSSWNTMSTEEKQEYSRNIYYPKNKYLDNLTENEDIDNMNYIAISFDTYRGKGDKKAKCGVKRITFAHPVGIEQYDDVVEYPDQTISKRGIMPKILRKLLKARKDTRKKIPLEKDEFKKGVLEGLQLGYKLSANSLYGQCGASTSAIFKQDVAAATTSTGRQMLNLCSSFAIQYYDCDIVYGDTDSVFVKYKSYIEDGVELKGKEKLRHSIQKSISLSDEIRLLLRKPHDLEYEKTFYPFILFSKKRYIGYLYEDDWKITPKLKYMGIVLKRRDNANIVKIFYGGVITRLLEDKTIDSAVTFLKEKLEELINGKFPIEDLTITKTLRGYYKVPESIAHKVLADRMGERDPGNKPSSNDRIPYVYISVKEQKGKKILQGDRVEHPDYINQHKLQIDYKFYITNQIMKPIIQIFEMCLDKPEEPFQLSLNKINRKLMGVKDISSYFK